MGRFDWNGKLTWLVLIYIASFQERTQMPCYTPEINAPKVPEHYLIKYRKLISFKSILFNDVFFVCKLYGSICKLIFVHLRILTLCIQAKEKIDY